jgi:hypothetical protein
LSGTAAISVIAVTTIGAGKPESSAASWTRAAATAQIKIVAAAQAMARWIMSRAFARTTARPVSQVAFALSLMTMAAISPPWLPAALSLPGPDPPGLSTSPTSSR